MRRRGGKGGIAGTMMGIFLSIVLILTVYKLSGGTVDGFRALSQRIGEGTVKCVTNPESCSKPLPAPAPPKTKTPQQKPQPRPTSTQKQETQSNVGKYSRSAFKHWIPQGRLKCWNTRDEVLARQGTSLVFIDGNKRRVGKNNACAIVEGKWLEPYKGKTLTNPRALDIDHIVPLSYAWSHGADKWDSGKREKFANDIDNNLLAVDASANREKGDKGPSRWMPSNKKYQCEYGNRFKKVIDMYGLRIDKQDLTAINKACR